MKSKLMVFVLGAGLAVSGAAWSAPLVMPNTLTTEGLPADANANFDATVDAVNDNNSRINAVETQADTNTAEVGTNSDAIYALEAAPVPLGPMRALSDGTSLGTLITINTANGEIIAMSDTGYLVFINGYYGVSAAGGWLYYQSTDCTGPAVMRAYPNNSGFYAQQGMMITGVVGNSNFGLPYYIPSGSVMEPNTLTLQSFGSPGDCRVGGIALGNDIIRVYPNDPDVTGVGGVAWVLPITLGR